MEQFSLVGHLFLAADRLINYTDTNREEKNTLGYLCFKQANDFLMLAELGVLSIKRQFKAVLLIEC